jgi:putative ABC transport system permease protein
MSNAKKITDYVKNLIADLKGMRGLFRIALKLLVNDKGKFLTIVMGVTFAVFLMNMMTSMFAGVLESSISSVANVGAQVWVMDPSVETPNNSIPLPDYVLDYVRSIKGVKFAEPIYFGGGLIKLNNGKYQNATIIGLDDASLFGRPTITNGKLRNIYESDAFIVLKDANYGLLDSPRIGTTFEINDYRGIVVAIAKTATPSSGLFGIPTLYTTYTRATRDLPNTRYVNSYVILDPKNKADIPYIKKKVGDLGYLALTQKDFENKIKNYYTYKTAMGLNIGLMTLISFIVGLSIAGQTFYAFVLENMEKFGALKAIGAQKRELVYMLLFQSSIVSFLGYGFGILLSSVMIALAKLRIPNYTAMVNYTSLAIAFFMVLLIAGFSSYIGIRKVLKIDPFDIFRG